MKKLIAALLVATLTLSFTPDRAMAGDTGPREVIGTLLGGALGGVAGAQFGKGRGKLVATGVGALAGAFIGRDIGRQLDRVSAAYHARTTQTALERAPTGRTSTWRNPDHNTRGSVTPVKTYRSAGAPCREYQQTIVIGGKTHEAYGTACRQPDGSWKIQ
jgi:surface antigen